MSIREVDLAQFSDFAREQIRAGQADVSLTSLAEQWERRQQSKPATESMHPNAQVAKARAYVEELASQQGVTAIRSDEDLRCDFLESEEELDEFLAAVKAGRREDKVRDPLND